MGRQPDPDAPPLRSSSPRAVPTNSSDPAGSVAPGPLVRGLGVSPGVRVGRVRVISDIGHEMLEPGEVLVCHTTDPSWASHLVQAGAVVIDIGGMLSHGAIIARELGLPCVINTRSGTTQLATGDIVRVDGDHGTVEITTDSFRHPGDD